MPNGVHVTSALGDSDPDHEADTLGLGVCVGVSVNVYDPDQLTMQFRYGFG